MDAPTRDAQTRLVRLNRANMIPGAPPTYFERDIDGIPGPRTKAMVAAFQREWNTRGMNQLRTDGVLDDETDAMLRRAADMVDERDRFGWTDDDYRALTRAAGELVARPADLLLVLFSESRLNPRAAFYDAKTRFPVAVGLNQITGVNARAMGISEAERVGLLKLSPSQQLPYVVRSFHAAAGRRAFIDAGQLYQVNFAPGTLSKGSGDNVVMYRREQGQVYTLNAGLDVDKSGTLTVGDLRAVLRRLAANRDFGAALERLRRVVGAEVQQPVVSDAA